MTTDARTAPPVPLAAPYRGADPRVAFARFWLKYLTFSGRASRSEFWWWTLIGVVVTLAIGLVGLATNTATLDLRDADEVLEVVGGGGLLSTVWALATLVPGLALLVRRLHDTDLAGWFALVGLVPVVGPIALLVLAARPPVDRGTRFDRR